MSERVVVLGAGYAGTVAVRTLEQRLQDADLTWVSERGHHLVRHEVHRVIADPDAGDRIAIPIETIASGSTTFRRGRVAGIRPDDRLIELAGGEAIDYDYALVALGSDTAFYGIPGLPERAHTLSGLEAARSINRAVVEAGEAADSGSPASVVVGGAGLSGVQTAGEVAALRDATGLPVEVTVLEALPEVLPDADPGLQRRVRRLLATHGIEVVTDDPVVAVTPASIELESGGSRRSDVLIWTGGITGRAALADAGIEGDHRRLYADRRFRTSDDRVFAVGDAAIVGLDGGTAPPTAQAARDGAKVAAENVARQIRGVALAQWTFRDAGTLVSVGPDAIAHGVRHSPVSTFGGPAAATLKKLVAARWIASISSTRRAVAAWSVL